MDKNILILFGLLGAVIGLGWYAADRKKDCND